LTLLFRQIQGDPAPTSGSSTSLPQRFKVGDAFLTVSYHMSDNMVLLGCTDAPKCIVYTAVGRITSSGTLIDIIKKNTIVRLSCGAPALVMGITQDKFGTDSIEPYLITQPFPVGKLKPVYVSRAVILKNHPGPCEDVLKAAALKWKEELANMLSAAAPPEDAHESSEESDSDDSDDSEDDSSSEEENANNRASEQRASIEEDDASLKASDDSDNENMEPNEEEGNKSPEMVATLAASATAKAAPRRSGRSVLPRQVSVHAAPTAPAVPAPKSTSKKKQAKAKAASATGKRVSGATSGATKKAPVVDLALILEKPTKRGIMRLTAEQLDAA